MTPEFQQQHFSQFVALCFKTDVDKLDLVLIRATSTAKAIYIRC